MVRICLYAIHRPTGFGLRKWRYTVVCRFKTCILLYVAIKCGYLFCVLIGIAAKTEVRQAAFALGMEPDFGGNL